MPANRVLGVDFGASYLAFARLDDKGRSNMIRSPQGDLQFDSVMYFEDDDFLFGRSARHAAVAQPARAAEYAKRDLGQVAYSRAIGGELLPAELIAGLMLKNACAEALPEGSSPPPVGLAIPASFGQVQRRGMLDAAQIAGLDVVTTINDPQAAALAFAESQGYLGAGGADKPGFRALVFDLGGGKLDVAIIEIKPNRIRTLGVTGDAQLGGRDWDARLADHLAEVFTKQFDADPRYDMASVRRLLETAAEAKHTLTARQQARVHVERQTQAADVTITRQMFEDVTADLVDRAKRVTEEALTQAAIAWRDVSQLLLVGGASRMPMIGKMLESLTGLKAATSVHPDEAVARGAALAAECALAARERRKPNPPLEIVDLTTHSLGIEWADAQTGSTENVVIIRRGTELPCATVAKVATTSDDQRVVTVQLLEGNSRVAAECLEIAEIVISDLPPGLPLATSLEVHYQISAQNRLSIRAQIPGKSQTPKIEVHRQRGLSDAQVANWKKLAATSQGLKPILALLPSQAALALKPRSAPAGRFPEPSAEPYAQDSVGQDSAATDEPFEGFEPHGGGSRARQRKLQPRTLAISVAGHVVFAALGLLVGYYILMWINPRFNTFHLRLPGLSPAATSGPVNTETH